MSKTTARHFRSLARSHLALAQAEVVQAKLQLRADGRADPVYRRIEFAMDQLADAAKALKQAQVEIAIPPGVSVQATVQQPESERLALAVDDQTVHHSFLSELPEVSDEESSSDLEVGTAPEVDIQAPLEPEPEPTVTKS
jgi:hypothetical protein